MIDNPIHQRGCVSFPVTIFIAGDPTAARAACRRYCLKHGLCVTITDTTYIYTGGAEEGVAVGLINYPRFPQKHRDIHDRAVDLALFLLDELSQGSATVQSPVETVWLSRRGDI